MLGNRFHTRCPASNRCTALKASTAESAATTPGLPVTPACRSTATPPPHAPIAEPAPLEHFVTARWGLHTRAHGRTLHLPSWHPRWPLHRAELLHLDDELISAAGLPAPAGPPASVLHSPGVPVRFGPPVALRRPA